MKTISDKFPFRLLGFVLGFALSPLLPSALCQAPAYHFATLAGVPPGSVDGTGSVARFDDPWGVAVDGSGNVYVADSSNDTIRKVTPAGVVTTFAGMAGSSGSADGTASAAQFNQPTGVAVDGSGNVYVADSGNETIRKITPGGVVTTLAGTAGGYGSADGTGSAAQFGDPTGVAVDGSGNVYVADSGNETIRKITPGGVVTTLAGTPGTSGSADGTGSAARFNDPRGIAVDSSGNVYDADFENRTIRKTTPAGVVTTLAGTAGVYGSADGTGSAAGFNGPNGVSVDILGNVYVSDYYNATIRKITPAGVVTTLAGTAGSFGSVDGTGSAARLFSPQGIAVDGSGTVYVAERASILRKITPAGAVTTIAGAASAGLADGMGSAAHFNSPWGVASDGSGDVYVADTDNNTIRKITPTGVVTTFVGTADNFGSTDGTGSAARFKYPEGIAVDSSGNIYVADSLNYTIRKITPAGVVTTLAGTAGSYGSADGTGSAAQFQNLAGIAVDSSGNVYVANLYTIRKITPAGVVTTFAGMAGSFGSADGTGSAAQFGVPTGVAVDSSDNVYVADSVYNTIRKITPAAVVTTIAGTAGNYGSADGIGSAAQFSNPAGVAVDGSGNVYVADAGNNTIRKITPTGVVTTIAGTADSTGFADGVGGAAQFNFPEGVAVDSSGNVYVADSSNNTIRLGIPATPLVLTSNAALTPTTVAAGYSAYLGGAASGGVQPYTYSLAAGTLPAGFTFNPFGSNGQISGSSTVLGSYPLTLMVTDAVGSTASVAIPLVIAKMSIGNPPTATAVHGVFFNEFLYTDGSSGQVTYAATGLPPGLTMTSFGQIRGTPTTGASSPTVYSVVVNATDSTNTTASATLQLTVAPLAVTSPNAFVAIQGLPYSYQLTAAGAQAPYAFALANGSALPTGLSLSSGGLISGTPAISQIPIPFTVTVTDSSTPAVTATYTAEFPVYGNGVPSPLLINGTLGTSLSYTIPTGNLTAPLSFSATPLAPGLTLNPTTGAISGTPTTAGSFTPYVSVTDSASHSGGTQSLTIVVPGLPMTVSESFPGTHLVTNSFYSNQISVTGGVAPYIYTVTAGALPTGISMNSNGQLSGTLSTAGSYSATITVADSAGNTAAVALPVTVASYGITNSSLYIGAAGVAYEQQFGVSGATGSVTFTATGLPAGLSLLSNGVLYGTVTTAGTYYPVITATDSGGHVVTNTYAVMIQALVGTSPNTFNLAAGVPFSYQLTEIGSTGPFTYAQTGGSLPAGLSLSPSGLVSGTVSTTGTSPFVGYSITDGLGNTVYGPGMNIVTGTLAIPTPVTPPVAVQGTPYAFMLPVAGGTAPYTFAATDNLPTGLTLNSSTGVISGIPTSGSRNWGVTFTVTDSSATPLASAPATIQFVVQASALTAILFDQDTNIITNSPYSNGFNVVGGYYPYLLTLASGSLPPGLSISGTQITGTPTTAGSYPSTVTLTDSAGTAVTVNTSLTVGSYAITSPTGVTAALGLPFATNLFTTGMTNPYTWSATGLPPGLTFNAQSGEVTGTPTTVGNYSPVFTVSDSSNPVKTTSNPILFTVQPIVSTYNQAVTAIVGDAYNYQLPVSGGTGPDTFAITNGGSLPAGLSLSSSGLLSGTPTAATSSVNFSYTVTDSSGDTTNGSFTTTVRTFGIVTPVNPPVATAGSFYSYTVAATGGTAPYTYSAGSSLPSGLTLNPSTGVISGTPTLGTRGFGVTINAVDSSATPQSASAGLTLVVTPLPLTIITPPAVAALVGSSFSFNILTTGGSGALEYTLSGSLPPGLSMSGFGNIAGTPTTSGSYPVSISVTDQSSATATLNLTIWTSTFGFTPSSTSSTAAVGVPFSFTSTTAGSTGAITFSASGLPPGLSVAASGTNAVVTGTPTTAGSYIATISATDSANPAKSTLQIQTITVRNVIVTGTPNFIAVSGVPYSYQLTAAGGAAPYTFAVTSGTLPSGLSLSSSGLLSGTAPATANASTSVTFTVTDHAGNTAPFTVTFLSRLFGVNSPQVVNGAAGTPLSFQPELGGGTAPYSISASGLPSGLTINAATGLIGGTTPAGGTFTESLFSTDSSSPALNGTSATLILNLTPLPLTATFSGWPTQLVGYAYAPTNLAVSGGVTPYAYAVTAGSLPPGMTLSSSGQVSGTPTAAGIYSATVTVTDHAGSTATVGVPITVGTFGFSFGTITTTFVTGNAISYNDSALGGTGAVTYSATNVPPGLTYNAATGIFSGLVTTPGTYATILTATDSTGKTISTVLDLTVVPLEVTNGTNITAIVGVPYNYQILVSGGTAPYTFTVPANTSAPSGLSLSSSGLISGTVAAAKSASTVPITITDSVGNTITTNFTFIAATFGLANPQIVSGSYGVPLTYTLSAGGGTPPYTFSTASTLPAGLTLAGGTGVISGTPTAPGSFTDSFTLTDSTGLTSPGTMRFLIAPVAPAFTAQPVGLTDILGQTVAFGVTATSTPSSTDQWQLNGSAISGATSGTLTLSDISASSAGAYAAVASYAGGTATSSAATLAIGPGYTFSTLAGYDNQGTTNGTGAAVKFRAPEGLSVDAQGNIYVADTFNYEIRKLTPAGAVTTFAGIALRAGSVDGPALSAQFGAPYATAMDSAGNIYVVDAINDTIRMISPAGIVSTIAGVAGASGSTDGQGSAARFDDPEGIAIDLSNNLYVADSGNSTIRKIAPGGMVTTLAGLAGQFGTTDGTGSAARFDSPNAVAVDAAGNVYVADTFNDSVRLVTPAGVVTTIAGLGGTSGSADGTGNAARFNEPRGIAVDASGAIYVADGNNDEIRQIAAGGVVTTLAGAPAAFGTVDGVGAAARLNQPKGLALDGAGNLWIADSGSNLVRKLVIATQAVSTPVGTPGPAGSADGFGAAARFSAPEGIARDFAGNYYVADTSNHTIRKVTALGSVGTIAGAAGAPGNANGTGTAASFRSPAALALDSSGNIYVADTGNNLIRKITPAGVVTTLAGTGAAGHTDGAAASAVFNAPSGIAVDAAGNVYVTDRNSHTIREISGGTVTTLAGTAGSSGSADGTGAAARFKSPTGIALDAAGNLYIGDYNNGTVRKIAPGGVVTTIAGLAGSFDHIDGAASLARFRGPAGLSLDAAGNIYVIDTLNYDLRMISAGGVVTTLNGAYRSFDYVDGTGSSALLGGGPWGVVSDAAGSLAIADTGNNLIRSAHPPGYPAITIQPAAVAAALGGSAIFSVGASASPAPSYQWYLGAVPIAGATGPTYTIPSAALTQAGAYTVNITNSLGTVTSAEADLSIPQPAGAVMQYLNFESLTAGPGGLNPGWVTYDYGAAALSGIGPTDPISGVVDSSVIGTGQAGYLGGAGTAATLTAASGFFGASVFPSGNTLLATNLIGSATPAVAFDCDFAVLRNGGINSEGFDFYIYDAEGPQASGPVFGYHSVVSVDAANHVLVEDNLNAAEVDTGVVLTAAAKYHLQIAVNYNTATWSATLTDVAGAHTYALATNRSINGSGYTLSGWTTLAAGWANFDLDSTVSSASAALLDRLVFDNYTTTAVTVPAQTAGPAAPVLPQTDAATTVVGSPFTYTPTLNATQATFTASPSLPAGLTLNANSGVISGTATSAAAATQFILTATNPAGTAQEFLTLTVAVPVPVITTSGISGTAGTALSAQIAATNSPTNFSAGALPNGLSLSSAGLVTGTPTAAGSTTVMVTATNGTGSSTAPVTFTIAAAPSAPFYTGAAASSGTQGAAFSYVPTFIGSATSFSLGAGSGALPGGLALNESTGAITGTASESGTFPLTLTATGAGGSTLVPLTITINASPSAPTITSASLVTGTTGAFSFTLTGSNTPTQFGAINLPSWASLDPVSGIISGTAVAGTTIVTVAALNGFGVGPTAALVIQINPAAATPIITSPSSYTIQVGTAYTFALSASGSPDSFLVTSGALPDGLTLSGGTIAGTPTPAAASSTAAIAAHNGSGLGLSLLVIFVVEPSATAPVITSSGSVSGQVGQPITYQIAATNVPTSYAVSGTLPAGLTLDPASGLITGVPSAATTSPLTVTLTASSAQGSGSKPLAFTIATPPAAPAVTSALTGAGQVGSAFSYQITGSNGATSFAATPLPAGLTVDPASGLISGTPAAAGTFTVELSAGNAGGLGTASPLSLVIAAAAAAPMITSPPTAIATTGTAFSYAITATSSAAITGYGLTGTLPTGLSVNTATGVISGSPVTPGTSTVSVTATSSAGISLPQSVAITVNAGASAPVVTSAQVAAGQVGTPFDFTLTASNLDPAPFPPAETLDAIGLPPGLGVNPSTGAITGTPTQAGDFTVTVVGQNAAGEGPAATLTVTIAPPDAAPVVTSAAAASAQANVPFNYQIAASNGPTSFDAVGAPGWLAVNTVTGSLSGTPAAPGTFTMSLVATNGSGPSQAVPLVITVAPAANTPVITSTLTASGTLSTAITPYQITATPAPTSYSAGNLPAGLTLDPTTGIISGTPTASGTFVIPLTGTNANGEGATATLTLTIQGSLSL